jgi:hypothetical protein
MFAVQYQAMDRHLHTPLHSHMQWVQCRSSYPKDQEHTILQVGSPCCEGSAEIKQGPFWRGLCDHYPVVNIYEVVVFIRMFVMCVELTLLMLNWICFVWLWEWKLCFTCILEYRTGRTIHNPMYVLIVCVGVSCSCWMVVFLNVEPVMFSSLTCNNVRSFLQVWGHLW